MKTLQVRDTMIVMTWVLGFSSPIKIEMILVNVIFIPKFLGLCFRSINIKDVFFDNLRW